MSTTDPPRPRRRSARRARARADLIAAARAVVMRDGVAALTVDGVAAEAGVSKPSVYYYFESKDDLLRSLAMQLSREEQAAVSQAVTASAPGPGILRDLVVAYVGHHRASLELFRVQYLWSQVVGLDELDLDTEVNAGMIALFDRVEQHLLAARDAGALRPGAHPRRLAVAAWMAAQGFVSTLALLDSGGTGLLHGVDDLLQELGDTLVRGAAASAPQHAGPP